MTQINTQVRWHVDDLCDRFEVEWKEGRRPHLAGFLAQHRGPGFDLLFRHLLELEIDYRSQSGEAISLAEYEQAFPEYKSISREVIYRRQTEESTLQVASDTRPKVTRSDPSDESIPTRIGDYELIEPLGQGGMGVVYKARQISLNRLVALKMIRSGELASRDELRRFRAEAEAAAKLEHPGIVPVYEVGEDQGRVYFSMGLVEGGGLDQLIAAQSLSMDQSARIVEQAARAVGYAHSRGVVHRDLKPANILLERGGTPRITDFGLAKIMQGDHDLTTTGQVLGTPSYMPPEQARGEVGLISPLSDVYSLGAVLYRLISGRVPFQAATLVETLNEVIHAEPLPPSQLVRGISADLNTICLKCLEKSPSRRYASAEALADELARFLRHEPILARPVSAAERTWRWCRRKPLVAAMATTAVAALLLGTIVSSIFAYSAYASATEAQKSASFANSKLKETEAAQQAEARERDRAEKASYLSDISLAHREWLDARAGAARDRLSATDPRRRGFEFGLLENLFQAHHRTVYRTEEAVEAACFAGDSKRVAVCSGKQLQVWDAQTGELQQTVELPWRAVAIADVAGLDAWGVVLATAKFLLINQADGKILVEQDLEIPTARAAAFSGDGLRLMAFNAPGHPLRVWDVANGRALPTPDVGGIQVEHFALSHDGCWFAVSDGISKIGLGRLEETNKLIREPVELLTVQIHDLSFTGDAARGDAAVTVAGSRCYRLPLASPQAMKQLMPEVEGCLQVATHGTTTVVADYSRRIRLGDSVFSGSVELRGHEQSPSRLVLSPDGQSLLAVGGDFRGPSEVVVWNLTEIRTQTEDYMGSQYGDLVALSADQTHAILVSRDTEKRNCIRVVETASGRTEREIDVGMRVASAAFSSDGQWLGVFCYSDDGKFAAGYVCLATGEFLAFPVQYPEVPIGARVSTGGKYVALVTRNLDRGEFMLRVWSRFENQLQLTSRMPESNPFPFAFSQRGDACALYDGEKVRLVPLEDPQQEESLEVPQVREIQALAFSSSDQLLAAGGLGGALVWRLDLKDEPKLLRGHYGRVIQAVFTADEQRLATIAEDKTIKIWELTQGRELLTLNEADEPYFMLGISPDDSRIVAATTGSRVRIEQYPTKIDTPRLKFPKP